jgi:hypothetical protein
MTKNLTIISHMDDYMQDGFYLVIILEHSGHGFSPQSRNNSMKKEPLQGLRVFIKRVYSVSGVTGLNGS